MELTLTGKTILITGSTQGQGAEIAVEAARRGASRIAICGRSAEKGEKMVQVLAKLGAEARYFDVDLIAPDAPAQLYAAVEDWAGAVHGLVNCAGMTDRASFLDGTVEIWDKLFALNSRAPYFLMQSFIKSAIAAGRPGSIVNIVSMNAHCGTPALAIYSATKGALATLTRNAANAHLSDRIRVNGINMGWAPTDAERDMQSRILGNGEAWLDQAAAASPLGRLLQPAEVARLCVYLLSDYSGLQTGTLIDLEQRVVGAP